MKKRTGIVLLVLTISVAVLGGCGSTQERNVLTELLTTPETTRELGYTIQWQYNLALTSKNRIIFAEVLGDRLAVWSTERILIVFDANTGKKLWDAQVGLPIEKFSKPVRVDDFIMICSESRAHAFHATTGVSQGFVPLRFSSNTTPVITNEYMIHGSRSGRVWAQDLRKGLLRWTYQMGSPVTSSPIQAGPSVLATDAKGTVVPFNPRSGAPLWRTYTWGRIAAQPAASDLLIYVPSRDESLYAVERNNGNVRWRYFANHPLKDSPIVMDKLVFQYQRNKGLLALDAFSGEVKWTMPYHNARPVMTRDEFVFIHRPGELLGLTMEQGDLVKKIALPKVDHLMADNTKGGSLYLINQNGKIMKISPKK